MGGDGFQPQRRKSWVPGKIRAEKVLADAITIDGTKEWICKFGSETNVWTRWRYRQCLSNIPAGLQRKHKETVLATNKEWNSGSSSSSGGDERWQSGQEEELKNLRAQVELLSKQQGVCGMVRMLKERQRGEEAVLMKTPKLEAEEEMDCKRNG